MAAHFYTQDGRCIEGIGAARVVKPLPLPSPTTVLSLLRSEGLLQYFKRQMHIATFTTPRNPTWTDEQYYKACDRWADEHGKTARTKGGDFHDEIERFHKTKWRDPLASEQSEAYCDWYDRYVETTIATETVVIGEGYAGRLDHLCQLRDGRVAVTDVKSQDISKRRTFNTYFEWGMQLGAYGAAAKPKPDVLVSVCVSSNKPVVLEAHYWPGPVDYYAGLFLGLLRIWREANSYGSNE